MAATSTRMSLGLLMVMVLVSIFSRPSYGLRKLAGGRSEVQDVESNRELQELGRYCVQEFNLREEREHEKGRGSTSEEAAVFDPLMFSRVVEAQEQVVSGIKYFLKIEVTLSDRTTRMFTSVVVIKPWLQSRELLDFSPVTNPLFSYYSP
ncbi:PREDICTED: cysteine proteinase inhibitor 2-like [Tarenaya hassleriana]|uniref:cysteine proteinase inhibitor 2-like n=1 Tax=Tarenaya hassleriana TaxID=28532 RepID=UPI00053C9D75|nr:PREDICTED: cysteine proteinase inhibitor 2-like [Tarenaya hassleriana]